MNEIDRSGMVGTGADGRKRRHAPQETIRRKRKRIVVVKALQRAGWSGDYRRHVSGADKRWKRRDAAAREIGVKRGSGIQALLNRQFQAACAYIAHFDTAVAEQLVLHAQGPGDDLW